MLRKLTKLKRYLQWRWKPRANIPAFWHVGRPNFGDDINPSFLQRVSNAPLRLATNQTEHHLLGVGSILEFATPQSVVLGSGYLRPDSGPVPTGTKVVSLRGQLSQQRAGCPDSILLGDPLVLVDQVFQQRSTKQYRLGLVAHVMNEEEMKTRFGRYVRLISPTWEPWRVVQEIACCELVASQSLHGLIVADALQIPNLWIAPSESMAGGRFKFDDYFSTLDKAKEPVVPTNDLFRTPGGYAFSVSQYKYSKPEYVAALAEAIRNFPAIHAGAARSAA